MFVAYPQPRLEQPVRHRLFASDKTVSVHVSNILRKLGVRTRVDAAARVHAELRRQGIHVSRKRVARLMRRRGLAGRCRRRWKTTTISDPTDLIGVDLLNFEPGTVEVDRATWVTSPTSGRGKAGRTSPPSSIWHRQGRGVGARRSHARQRGVRRPQHGDRHPTAAARAHLPLKPRPPVHLDRIL